MLLTATFAAYAQSQYDETGWLPSKEDHLVYDYYGILSDTEKQQLEERLVAFDDSTSNQIVVMFTPGFGGRDISSFAFELGDEWGIGQNKLSNGVVIVVKPKDQTDGQVEIATGLGLEGALPDIFCKRIIEDVMIPHFRDNDYYGAVCAALDIILPVCAGEYSYSQYKEDNSMSLGSLVLAIFIVAAIFWLVYKLDKSSGSHGGGHGGTYYGGNTRMSSWGGTSWSGSSGGFGGFGGGSFGGGGASGRW